MEVAGLSPDVVDIMAGVWQEPFFETAFRVLSLSSDRRYNSTEQNHRFHKVGKLSMLMHSSCFGQELLKVAST